MLSLQARLDLPTVQSDGSIWAWSPQLEWIWIDQSSYSNFFIWSLDDNNWLFFDFDSNAGPRIYKYLTEEWSSFDRDAAIDRSIRFSNLFLSPVDLGPAVQSAAQSHLIGKSHVSSARQAKTDSRYPDRPIPDNHFLQVMASGLPFHVVPQGQNHLAYFVAFDFGPQAFDIKLLGPTPRIGDNLPCKT